MDILSDVSVSGKLVAQKICAIGHDSSVFRFIKTNVLYIDDGPGISRNSTNSEWLDFASKIRTTEFAAHRIRAYGDRINLGNSQEPIIVCGVLQEPSGNKFVTKKRVQISVPESCLKFYVGGMYEGWHPIVTAWDTKSGKRIELDYGYDGNSPQFFAQRTNSEALCLTFYYI